MPLQTCTTLQRCMSSQAFSIDDIPLCPLASPNTSFLKVTASISDVSDNGLRLDNVSHLLL